MNKTEPKQRALSRRLKPWHLVVLIAFSLCFVIAQYVLSLRADSEPGDITRSGDHLQSPHGTEERALNRNRAEEE